MRLLLRVPCAVVRVPAVLGCVCLRRAGEEEEETRQDLLCGDVKHEEPRQGPASAELPPILPRLSGRHNAT